MARISTHVLDTARGLPAAGIAIELFSLDGNGRRQRLAALVTNEDGRTAEPLLQLSSLTPGVYELVFHAGDYFRSLNLVAMEPPFLDRIAVQFGVSAPLASYHVPLLLSPYSYSTYRGS